MSAPNPKEEGLRAFMSSTGIPVEWIRRLLESDTITDQLQVDIANLENATITYHVPIVQASSGTNAPGQQPDIGVIGSTLVAEFTLNADTAYRVFKIPAHFIGSAVVEAHWTKESGAGGDIDVTTSGAPDPENLVKWRISYDVFNGIDEDINVAPAVVEIEDTYDDSGTTTRIVYKTGDVAITGLVAGYYLGIQVESVTPSVGGQALACEPALITIDLEYEGYINK
jgi:hypothetical protein